MEIEKNDQLDQKQKQSEKIESRDKMEIDEENEDLNDQDKKSSKFLKRGRIFIRNLPFSTSEKKLKDLFSPFGEIKEFNLPYDENKKMLKGFCFLQYDTKKEALKAISELNGKNLNGRKIQIEIAKPKNEYIPLPNIENENFKNRSKSTDEKSEKNEKKKTLENDPTRTLFVRNLGFETSEDSIKTLFSKYGKLKYCLVCRNKETKASKGSGFIMFEKKEDLENVLKIFEKYELNKDYSGINPFELEGRNLKLFKSIGKDEAEKNKENKSNENKNEDNRNRELLYYGLNNYYDFINKDNVTEEDKQRRETIIQLKKTNFKKNPNLHISETRLVIRNLDKTFDEKKIKELFREKTEQFLDECKKNRPEDFRIYKKVKKIKQIKLIRDEKVLDKDNNPKSKSVAFVEVCDKNFGKWLINNMSNLIISKNKKKGLIIDFALDDIRKIRNRLIKLDKLKMLKKSRNEENFKEKEGKIKKDKKSIDKKIKNEEIDGEIDGEDLKENENEMAKESINNINDPDKLAEIYKKTLSRGKKQRIKKRVEALGLSLSVLGKPKELNFGKVDKNILVNKNKFFDKTNLSLNEEENKNEKKFFENLKKGKQESYTVVRVNKDNMNINKKIKENLKKEKNKEKRIEDKMINNKRSRTLDVAYNRNGAKLNEKNKQIINKKKKDDEVFDDSDDEIGMSGYISKIEEKLRKSK